MSRRETLLAALSAHRPHDGIEADHLARTAAFVRAYKDPFSRELRVGHVTGSALVASPSLDQVVLVRHRALDRWLQPGGHTESGDVSPLAISLREAREETGLAVRAHPAWQQLFDVDVHTIPANGDVPAHLHLDVRHLLVADPAERPRASDDGVSEAHWFTTEDARTRGHGVGLARMLDKVDGLRVPQPSMRV